MGITEILRRIWLFSANKIKTHRPTQLIIAAHNCHKSLIAVKYYEPCEKLEKERG